MSDWSVRESVTEHEAFFHTSGYDLVEQPNGEEQKYDWIDLSDIVVIVAIHDNEVVLVEQYRPAVESTVLECPAGVPEGDESPAEAAVRELREETGFRAGSADVLYSHNPLPGLLRHTLHIVFADDLTPGETDMDPGEFIEQRTVLVSEAIETVRQPPGNGMSLTALLIAQEDGLL